MAEFNSTTFSPSPGQRSTYRRAINRLLHAPVPIKAQLLFSFLVVGSVIQALELLPETVFSNKNNPVNQYLVKLSWMWTLTFLIPTVLITAVDSSSIWEAAVGHFGRIFVGHNVWFGVTSLIDLLDNTLGECSEGTISSAKSCIRGGHEWSGFDISGHVFLLSYCIFVITEEAASLRPEVWREVGATGCQTWLSSVNRGVSNFIAGGLEMYALVLVLIWTVMIVATSLYFHTFLEKLLGCVVAVAIWKLTYGYIYGKSDYLPCQPRGSGSSSSSSSSSWHSRTARGQAEGDTTRKQQEERTPKRVRFDSRSDSLVRNSLQQTTS